jgi:ATP-dependent DNA helicase PIF1
MFVANNALEWRYNGTIGKVVSLDKDDVHVELPSGDIVSVAPYTRNVRQYVFDSSVGHLSSKDVWSFTQLPITLARAITIHKSQWKTFDRVIIDLWHGIFAHGQTYVALSRCRSLEGVQLVAPLQKSHVIMDRRVTDFITKYQYAASAEKMSTEEKILYIQKAIAEKNSWI